MAGLFCGTSLLLFCEAMTRDILTGPSFEPAALVYPNCAVLMSGTTASTWLSHHKPELKLALRMTVSSVAAFAVATAFGLQQGYWSALTALIVTQTNVGGSLKVAVDRMLASLCGAIYGAAITVAMPHHSVWTIDLALVAAVAPLAILAAFNAGFRVAPITSIIVLFGTTASSAGPISYATERVIEIALGCGIGLAVSSLLLPAHAYTLVLEATAKTTALLAKQLEALGSAIRDPMPHLGELQDEVRKALNNLETLADEVARERRNRLSDEPDPEPLYRTLRRLRQDIASLTRALGEPLPDIVQKHFAEPWLHATRAAAAALLEQGQALVSRQTPASLDHVIQTIADFKAEVEKMRAAGVTRGLSGDAIYRVFGIVFVLEQLRGNLEDLASRTDESALKS
jgi:uncharacterized membrane protein YccC